MWLSNWGSRYLVEEQGNGSLVLFLSRSQNLPTLFRPFPSFSLAGSAAPPSTAQGSSMPVLVKLISNGVGLASEAYATRKAKKHAAAASSSSAAAAAQPAAVPRDPAAAAAARERARVRASVSPVLSECGIDEAAWLEFLKGFERTVQVR